MVQPKPAVLHSEIRPLQQVLGFLQLALEKRQVTVDYLPFLFLLLVVLLLPVVMVGACHFSSLLASVVHLEAVFLPAIESAHVLFEGCEAIDVSGVGDRESLGAGAFGGPSGLGEFGFELIELLAAVLVVGAFGDGVPPDRLNKH